MLFFADGPQPLGVANLSSRPSLITNATFLGFYCLSASSGNVVCFHN